MVRSSRRTSAPNLSTNCSRVASFSSYRKQQGGKGAVGRPGAAASLHSRLPSQDA